MNTAFIPENLASMLPAFEYNGQDVQLAAWHKEELSDCVSVYHSPDGLLDVRITRKLYPGYPVLELLPELIACGKEKTGRVRNFQSLSVQMDMPFAECALRVVHGAETNPLDFAARRIVM